MEYYTLSNDTDSAVSTVVEQFVKESYKDSIMMSHLQDKSAWPSGPSQLTGEAKSGKLSSKLRLYTSIYSKCYYQCYWRFLLQIASWWYNVERW